MSINGNKQKGLAMIAIVLLMFMAILVFATAFHVLGELINEPKIQLTYERMFDIEAASIGNRYQTRNDSGGNWGYFGRYSSFPNAVFNDLIDGPPYFLPNRFYNQAGFWSDKDAFNQTMEIDTSGGFFAVRSGGPDRNMGASGDNFEIRAYIGPMTTADISVMIKDATVSADMAPAYVSNDDGHTILDPGEVDVDLIINPSDTRNYSSAPNQFNAANNMFEFNNIPFGVHELLIKPQHIDDIVPQRNDANNDLHTSLFVYPTVNRQYFQVLYPCKPRLRYKREIDSQPSEVMDKTIDALGNDYDAFDAFAPPVITSGTDFQVIGTDLLGGRYRALLTFDLTAGFDDPQILSTSKILFAYLTLYQQDIGPGPPGNSICVHEYLGANWTEATNHVWGNVNTAGTDYGNTIYSKQRYFLGVGEYYFYIPASKIVQRLAAGGQLKLLVKLEFDGAGHLGEFWRYFACEVGGSGDSRRPRLTIAYYR